MDRDQFVLGLAAVFAGLTTLLVVAALARQPFLLVVAIPFAATTYLLWYHATGRLAARVAESESRSETRRQRPFQAGPGGRRRQPRGGRRRRAGARSAGPSAGMDRGPSRDQAYRTLDLSPDASDEAVRRAYREKVKQVHPDTESGDEEAFKRVNRAYEQLTE